MLLRAPAFNVDDHFDPVYRLCESLAPIWNLGPHEPWTLDVSGCGYLGPDAAVLIYATWLAGRQRGQPARVLLPNAPAPLAAFCTFSGLDHVLLGGKRPNPHHPECETVPLNQFYQAIGNQSAPIVDLVKRHMTVSADAEVYLGAAFSEVVQNIEDHAQSPFGGISCARFFAGKRQVRVAVVDFGVGIAGSLGRTIAGITPVDAIKRVLQGGTSSRSLGRNMGLGVSNLAAIVRNLHGDLAIYSQSGAALLGYGGADTQFKDLPVSFPGTAVFFRLNVDERDWR